jgi:replication factor C subunit 3/5
MQPHIPWVEKYRPNKFDDIVLDNFNRKILLNIIKTGSFPNIIFYGPPGTGKTTTIINLIKHYQEEHNEKNKNLVIHLNASDDRGIDVIRNQIISFVHSNALFVRGKKFIILDEVDYMTKNAQCALQTLIQQCPNNVVFCLICNYISRMDSSLQNEFVRLRFSICINRIFVV